MLSLTLSLMVFVTPLAPPADLLPEGAKLEKLWGEGAFTEGGALAGDGSILFSDIPNEQILRFDPETGQTSVFRKPSGRANGLIFDPKGRLIAAEGADSGGNRRVSATEADGQVRTLADKFEGKRLNSPNDVTVDRQGRIYFSDPRFGSHDDRELDHESVYRIDPDGSLHFLETGAKKPNGLAISPDGKTFYVADSDPENRVLLAWSLDTNGDLTGKARVLKNFGDGRGIDGMRITTDGLIVAAAGAGRLSGVYIYNPQGVPLGFIPTPENATNVEFGGPDDNILYITAGKSLYRIPTKMTAYRLWPSR